MSATPTDRDRDVSSEEQAPFATPEEEEDAYIVSLPLVELALRADNVRSMRAPAYLWACAYGMFVCLNGVTAALTFPLPHMRQAPTVLGLPQRVRVPVISCEARNEDDHEGHQRDQEDLPQQQDAPPDHKLEHKQEQEHPDNKHPHCSGRYQEPQPDSVCQELQPKFERQQQQGRGRSGSQLSSTGVIPPGPGAEVIHAGGGAQEVEGEHGVRKHLRSILQQIGHVPYVSQIGAACSAICSSIKELIHYVWGRLGSFLC